jgi:hypothetical protein
MAFDPLAMVRAEALRQGVDPEIAARVLNAESGGRLDAVSPKGARGLMQLMPATAAGLGVNPDDPADNIRGGVTYLRQMRDQFGGDPSLMLAAYNAGPGNVQKYGGVPPFAETKAYVRKILGDQATARQGVQTAQSGGGWDALSAFGLKGGAGGAWDGMSMLREFSARRTPEPMATTPQPYTPSPEDMANEPPPQQPAPDTIFGQLANSPVGGALRGLRDIPDAGAQLITRGLEAIAPAGSGMEAWARGQRQNVEGINAAAEKDYQQNWRKEQMGDDLDAGRLVGNIAGALPIMAVPGLGGASIASGAALGAATGAMTPVQSEEGQDDFWREKLSQTAIGGALGGAGGALGAGVSRLLKPVQSTLPEGAAPAVAAAENLGVRLTPGEATGSKTLKQFEDVLSRTPGASGAADALRQSNQAAINRAAASSIGESGDAITEGMLAGARARLGNAFINLSADTKVPLGDDFVAALTKIDTSNRGLGAFALPEVDQLVSKGLDLAAKGELDGKAYQALRSRLGDRASDAFRSGNSEVGQALKSLRESLDDAAASNMPAAKREAWAEARKQWGNLKALEKGNVVKAGDVNPTLVGGALRQFNPKTYKEGGMDGPLMDIARYGEAFKPPAAGSQTYERGLASQMLFGNPLTGVPSALSAATVQGLLSSRPGAWYLKNGLLPLTDDMQAALTRGGAIGGAIQGPGLLGWSPQRR